jgi:hypothetical protein
MDAAAAAKLVSALDQELARRQSRRDAVEDAAWAAEFSELPRSPAGSTTPEDREVLLEAALDFAKSFFSLAEAIDRAERHKEFEASVAAGTPRRKPVIITPRIRSVAGLQREPAAAKTVDAEAKSKKMSRTEQWRAEQEAQFAARQQLVPQPPSPSTNDLGWHRGVMEYFDQIGKTGVVKFAGLAGFTEAAMAPGAATRSGHANFFPGERVDCRLVRHLDGSVAITDVKLSSSADPQNLEAEAAAVRVRLQRKWRSAPR